MRIALLAFVVLAGGAGMVQAESPQRFNEDFNATHESGPPVVSGSGATAGPNFRNQATLPMPGRDFNDRPKEIALPMPEAPTIVVPKPARDAPPRKPQ